MGKTRKLWLVVNPASGSNDDLAVTQLRDQLQSHNFDIARQICFPEEPAPTPGDLAEAGIDLLAIYTGDGTINACLTTLAGWPGEILILPGGTMNLLFHRLHGEADALGTIGRVANGAVRAVTPTILQCEHGTAYVTALVGPATRWGDVREAMRTMELGLTLTATGEAVRETTDGTRVRLCDPDLGRRDGYALMELMAGEWGMQIDAHNPQTPGDYLHQTWALLRRQFRDGPRDRIGMIDTVTCENVAGEPVELLLDGEAVTGGPRVTFTTIICRTNLLASEHG